MLLLKTGLCGGFTTFSTFALETSDLMQTGHLGIAVGYVMASMAFGVAAVFVAQWIFG